jgi:hypothetical protein
MIELFNDAFRHVPLEHDEIDAMAASANMDYV